MSIYDTRSAWCIALGCLHSANTGLLGFTARRLVSPTSGIENVLPSQCSMSQKDILIGKKHLVPSLHFARGSHHPDPLPGSNELAERQSASTRRVKLVINELLERYQHIVREKFPCSQWLHNTVGTVAAG